MRVGGCEEGMQCWLNQVVVFILQKRETEEREQPIRAKICERAPMRYGRAMWGVRCCDATMHLGAAFVVTPFS